MSASDIEQPAADWLARIDAGNLNPSRQQEFDNWRDTDARHAAAYARLAATWQALDRVQAIRPPASEPIDADYLISAALRPTSPQADSVPAPVPKSGTTKLTAIPRLRRPNRSRWRSLSIAASFALAVTVVSLWVLRDNTQTYRTGVGGFQHIVLADSSAIDLNTDSEVRVHLGSGTRNVELLRGEAGFEVAHDVNRPFIVAAGVTAVRAVGTKFDVRRSESGAEVIVDEGRVVVGSPDLVNTREIIASTAVLPVIAGQSATGSGAGVKLNATPKASLERKLAWQNQMLVFDGDSLGDVVAQFNRYNARKLILADPKLAQFKIGGYFKPTNLDAFLSVMQSELGVRVSAEGDQVLLAPARAN